MPAKRNISPLGTSAASPTRRCLLPQLVIGSASPVACASVATAPRSRRSTPSFPGSHTTPCCTSPCRMAWSSTAAPHGARAMCARDRSSFSSPSRTTSRSNRSCASCSRSSTKRAATGRSGSCSSRTPPFATGTAIATHVDTLLATVRERFIPGTHLIRYGEGDWNDSLQPADPKMRDWMVSSWTVALLFQQLTRYAEILTRAGRADEAKGLCELAAAMREDFNRHLIRAGTVAGYALFEPGREEPELLLHPSDTRTGLRYSLLPMTRSIIAGLFTREQAQHHLRLIREHLLFPDGARLMDRPVTYQGGLERVFSRAESSSFFGREIGLMYVHAHLRYGEAMAVLGEVDALWEALRVADPITVTEHLPNASPRQRNAYFSSSDAAFPDRYRASAEWQRVWAAEVAVDGGWRIYSSGPGLYTNLLLSHALGIRRRFGKRTVQPLLPHWLGPVALEMVIDGRRARWDLSPSR